MMAHAPLLDFVRLLLASNVFVASLSAYSNQGQESVTPVHIRKHMLSGQVAADGRIEVSDDVVELKPQSTGLVRKELEEQSTGNATVEILNGLVDSTPQLSSNSVRKSPERRVRIGADGSIENQDVHSKSRPQPPAGYARKSIEGQSSEKDNSESFNVVAADNNIKIFDGLEEERERLAKAAEKSIQENLREFEKADELMDQEEAKQNTKVACNTTSYCPSGLACSDGYCQAVYYYIPKTYMDLGSCQSDITSSSECSDAAQALGYASTTVYDDGQSGSAYDPPYCYYQHGSLKYNSNGQNTGSCGLYAECLCRKTAAILS